MSQFTVRKQGKIYVAAFNQDCFSSDWEPRYSGPIFNQYLTTGQEVTDPLELVASANLGNRSYTTIEGKLSKLKTQVVSKQQNIAAIHSGIINHAQKIAEQEEVPYFGLVVVADVERETVNVDEDSMEKYLSFKCLSLEQLLMNKYIDKKEKKIIFKNNKCDKPEPVTYVLHPTIQLYEVRK